MKLNSSWKIVYQFPPDSVLHIHSIIPDYIRKKVYILTGDEDKESGIWEADNSFHSVHPVLLGCQSYRACFAMSSGERLVYATDSPLETNYLIDLVREPNDILVLKKQFELSGSVIYGTVIPEKNAMIFSITVEPDPTLPRKRYVISRKLGKGIKDDSVRIMEYNYERNEIIEILKVKRTGCL